MGYFYVKVIETKKVAIRSAFYVNYPFVRLLLNGKEQKNTNFRAGIEWWDKIFCFRLLKYAKGDHYLIAQARDKSIHVFGSDWIGEVNIPLKDLLDGKVHQKWFKLGRGRKNHPKQPRGYIHLAFNYFEETAEATTRPFSAQPVEKVMTFEEFLSSEGEMWGEERLTSWGITSQSNINPSPAVCSKRKTSTPKTPKTKVSSKSRSKSATPRSDKLKKKERERARNSDSYDNERENSESAYNQENNELIDFEDADTVRSEFNGMFPPFGDNQFLSHHDINYPPPPAYSDSQFSPVQDQFGDDNNHSEIKDSPEELRYSHDVRDVTKSSDDNNSNDIQKEFSPPKYFRHQSTGKNPFLVDADPFSNSVGAH